MTNSAHKTIQLTNSELSLETISDERLVKVTGGTEYGYTIKKGDTLWDIAGGDPKRLAALKEKNPEFKANPDLIRPGQKVKIDDPNLPGGVEP